jgi:hypothetical protein
MAATQPNADLQQPVDTTGAGAEQNDFAVRGGHCKGEPPQGLQAPSMSGA